MIIGRDFNKKCEQILIEAGKLSGMQPGIRVSVDHLNQDLNFDRIEIRNYFEYLSDCDLIRLATIGGPFLYGHITLTKKGLAKLSDLQRKRDSPPVPLSIPTEKYCRDREGGRHNNTIQSQNQDQRFD